jgi:hypothetical protein
MNPSRVSHEKQDPAPSESGPYKAELAKEWRPGVEDWTVTGPDNFLERFVSGASQSPKWKATHLAEKLNRAFTAGKSTTQQECQRLAEAANMAASKHTMGARVGFMRQESPPKMMQAVHPEDV